MDAVDDIAKAIVRAAPERTIWGSDWPHIPDGERLIRIQAIDIFYVLRHW